MIPGAVLGWAALYAMVCRLGHGPNKIRQHFWPPDSLHRTVLQVSLEIQLRKWRRMDLPLGSIMDLLRFYERIMSVESSFCNWWDMWQHFQPAERLELLRRVSLVFPDFAHCMLDNWYRYSVGYDLESMD